MPVIATKAEDGKRDYVRDKRQNHTAAASEQVGDGPAGNFYQIDEKLTKADQDSDLRK